MTHLILDNEILIRVGAFVGVFVLVATWETLAPRRANTFSRSLRWPSNFGLLALNALAVRFLFPLAAVGTAALVETMGWGLLNVVRVHFAIAVLISVIALDLAIYLQHLLFHAVPVLWRLHRVHHTDLDFDVTTGIRFHPFEIILSMLIKLSAVTIIGAPVVAILIFEVLLNATSMFNHGNIRLPESTDRLLRLFIVTPDMHRVHHSVLPFETNSNFGFNLPWWDYLFGTYRAQPNPSHDAMTVGIKEFRGPKSLRFAWLLIQPALGTTGDYTKKSLGRRPRDDNI